MSKSIKSLIAVSLLALVAACGANNNDEVVEMQEPVTMEPTYTGKL